MTLSRHIPVFVVSSKARPNVRSKTRPSGITLLGPEFKPNTDGNVILLCLNQYRRNLDFTEVETIIEGVAQLQQSFRGIVISRAQLYIAGNKFRR